MRIGEAAARSGVPVKTIRYYESIGLIGPAARGENSYRTYDESDAKTLRFISRARALQFSLKDVASLLALYRDGARPSRQVRRLALAHVAEIDRKIAELRELRGMIGELAERCPGNERPECPILDELAVAAG